MNFRTDYIILYLVTEYALVFADLYTLNQSMSDESVFLSEIITNYTKKYITDDYQMSISATLASFKPNGDQRYFQEDVLSNLVNGKHLTYFTYNIFNNVNSPTFDRRNTFNLILIDDTELLPNILNDESVAEYYLFQKYMIVVTEFHPNVTNTLNECFRILWNCGLINSHVLIRDEVKSWSFSSSSPSPLSSWSLYTFLPYQKGCSTLSTLKLASFKPSNFTKITLPLNKVYPEKLENFHRCPLIVAASIINPLVLPRNVSDQSSSYYGIDIDIITQMSETLNFAIIFKGSPDNHGVIFPNGSVSGNLGLVFNGEAAVTIGGYLLTKERSELFSTTAHYLQASFGFCYKEVDAYISITRLMAPFRYRIWLMSGAFLLLSSLIILLTKKLNKRRRHFLIGGHLNRTPILNLWTTVLGNPISNPKMLKRQNFGTFARTLTILWIIHWLIIRNAYQGALYTYLQANRLTSDYDTTEKIRKSDCKIMVPRSAYNLIRHMFNADRIVYIEQDFMSNLPILYDKNIEGVALATDLTQKAFNLQNSPRRRLAFTKDRLFMYSPVFLFRKKSMLKEIFDEQIQNLSETGFIEFWMKKYTDHRNVNKKQRQPSKLRMENIEAAFQICGVMYLISFLVFLFELISTKYQCIKYFIDYLTH